MPAVARNFTDVVKCAAGWQLIGQGNLQRFRRQLRISRRRQRVVVILLFLDAGRFQSELMQFVPGRFVGISSDDEANRRAQIRRKRSRIEKELLKAFFAAGDDFLVVQIAECRD